MLRSRVRTFARAVGPTAHQYHHHHHHHFHHAPQSTRLLLAATRPHVLHVPYPLLRSHHTHALGAVALDTDDDATRRNDARGTQLRLAGVTHPLLRPVGHTATPLPAFHSYALAVFAARSYGTSTTTTNSTTTTTSKGPTAPTPPVLSPESALAKKRIAAARRRRSKIKAQEQKLVSALEKGGERQLIRVDNINIQQIPKVSEQAVSLIKRVPQMTLNGLKTLLHGLQLIYKDPAAVRAWLSGLSDKIKHEAKHYWLGTKLLYADVTTSTRIVRRLVKGNALSRRERKQLQRTVADLLRLVPFAFFVIVPFMELLLPVALKMFPNMLPSTYKDSFQREEDMKRQLQLRVSLAEFLQETVKEVMQDTRDTEGVTEEHRATAGEVMSFVERAQRGEPVSAEETLKVAKLFNDELMLDNISRPQLVGMCRYMGVQHYGNDNFLRFTLRSRIRQLKKDDQDIIWEGLDSLDKEELQQACMERGMRATGLTKAGYMRQMRQWLDLSINKNVPTSLLILSRALNITAADSPEAALATSLSSMDEEVVTEVALSASGKESTEMRELKLESIRYQNEMIADEEKFRSEAKRKADEETAAAAAAATQESEAAMEAGVTVSASVGAEEATTTTTAKSDSEPTFAAAEAIGLTPDASLASATTPVIPVTPPPTQKSIEDIISLEELGALESLAFKSIVEKERQLVDQMKQSKSEMDVEGLLAAGRIGAQSRENKTADRMLKRLDSMLSNLEVELDKVDRDIGDRLNLLDHDSDGLLSIDEFKHAVMTVLRKSTTEEDVDWLISLIDEDSDGLISIEELANWVTRCRELLEATGQIQLETAEPVVAAASPEGADAAAKAPLKRTSSRKASN